MMSGKTFPSPLAGEGGPPRSGEGEGAASAGVVRRQPPHLPIAAQWVPSSPARGYGIHGSAASVAMMIPEMVAAKRSQPLAMVFGPGGL